MYVCMYVYINSVMHPIFGLGKLTVDKFYYSNYFKI